ncbi:MAG TPA: CDP-alcohol phosphatidyltransferase family protein [Actinomycetota bacterium]|nr:CDP-alcohol phosphatidyltransferase family protein [Actinomycetota bacterium]
MDGSEETAAASRRVLTVPNLLSFLRICLIPVFVLLIVDEATTTAGLVVFAVVMATDWVDGYVARRTGQVTELGKILDPVADRLAIAAGLIALVVRGVFPVWAALLILVRDAAVLVVGLIALRRAHLRLDVRWIGKVATFSLMIAIPAVSWGMLGLPLDAAALVLGWSAFAIGIVEYYLAAAVYLGDLRRGLASARSQASSYREPGDAGRGRPG